MAVTNFPSEIPHVYQPTVEEALQLMFGGQYSKFWVCQAVHSCVYKIRYIEDPRCDLHERDMSGLETLLHPDQVFRALEHAGADLSRRGSLDDDGMHL